jgi:hypothetical protein
LTLVVVPAVFCFVDDLERWFAPRVARLLSSEQDEKDQPAGTAAQPAG